MRTFWNWYGDLPHEKSTFNAVIYVVFWSVFIGVLQVETRPRSRKERQLKVKITWCQVCSIVGEYQLGQGHVILFKSQKTKSLLFPSWYCFVRNRLKSTDNFTSRSTKHDISKFTGKVMLSVMCICQHGSSLYDHHLDKLVHLGTPPQPGPGPHHQGTCSPLLLPSDMFQLVHLDLTMQGSPSPSRIWLESGRLAFDWTVFLFWNYFYIPASAQPLG